MAAVFCVVCGRSDRPTVDGICADCFADRTPLLRVPERSTVVLCPTCGARKVGRRFEGRGRPTILGASDLLPLLDPHPDVAIRKVDWIDESVHPLLREVEGEAHLLFRGTERTERVRLTVRIAHRTCPECSRRAGHYFAATVQWRALEGGPKERPIERRDRLLRLWETILPEARADWREAVSWATERPEGWDFYFTDTLAARSVARMAKRALSGTLTESATLWGRKNGQDVYRVTLCVRVPYAPAPTPAPARAGRAPDRGVSGPPHARPRAEA